MLLARLAHVSQEVAATSARSRKIALLAELFRDAEADDVPIVIPYLAGRLPQGRLGVGWKVLSRPVARDVVASTLEIPYQVPGSRVRLRVKRDRLVLDRLRSDNRTTRKIIRWPELRSARLDELAEPTTWRAGPSTVVEVPAGPVLRITGGDEWLIPVTEAMGEDLEAAITLRSHNNT